MNVHGPDLAWALVDATKPHLSALERNYTFVSLGAGDTFAAVHHLLGLIAAKRIPLQAHLVMLCRTWLGTYVGHEEYEHLRGLVEGFTIPATVRTSAVANRISPTQRRTVQSVANAERVTPLRPERRQRTWATSPGQDWPTPPPLRREVV